MLLRRRLLAVFSVYVLIFVLGAVATLELSSARDSAREAERTAIKAQTGVAHLQSAFVDQETAARGYVITGQNAFLTPFTTGGKTANRILRGSALSAHGSLTALVRETDLRYRAWRERASLEVTTRTQAGELAATTLVSAGISKQLFDGLRAATDRLDAQAAKLAARDLARVDARRRDVTIALSAVLAGALAWTVIAAWLVRKWVTLPLKQISRVVRTTRYGPLEQRVPIVGPPELTGLASDIDRMRVRLNTALANAVQARETIEQSAGVVLSLRSQLETDVDNLPSGWTAAAQVQPADGLVAGDCYDLILMPEQRLGAVVVDISGHGAVSGILALRCKELLRAALRNGLPPGEALSFANAQLDDLGDEEFLSAFVAVVDLASGAGTYANAGHPPALVSTPTSTREQLPTGPLVGLDDRARWSTGELQIDAGEILAIYTDGLTESRDKSREQYGPERLATLLRSATCDEAPVVAKRCIDEVTSYQYGSRKDDITVVLICHSAG
jgi:sigma-B regulation protein RsbU (phosphoserine phosphatase)